MPGTGTPTERQCWAQQILTFTSRKLCRGRWLFTAHRDGGAELRTLRSYARTTLLHAFVNLRAPGYVWSL